MKTDNPIIAPPSNNKPIGQNRISLEQTLSKLCKFRYNITSSGLSTALSTDLDPSGLTVILSKTLLPSGLTVSVVVTVPGVANIGSSSAFAAGILKETTAQIANRTLAASANPAPILNMHPSSHTHEEK